MLSIWQIKTCDRGSYLCKKSSCSILNFIKYISFFVLLQIQSALDLSLKNIQHHQNCQMSWLLAHTHAKPNIDQNKYPAQLNYTTKKLMDYCRGGQKHQNWTGTTCSLFRTRSMINDSDSKPHFVFWLADSMPNMQNREHAVQFFY